MWLSLILLLVYINHNPSSIVLKKVMKFVVSLLDILINSSKISQTGLIYLFDGSPCL